MNEVVLTQARDRLADLVEETQRLGEPTWVIRDGHRVGVILAPDVFDRLVDLAGDALDRRELEKARADDDYLPWDEVKAVLELR